MRAIAIVRDTAMVDGPGAAQGHARKTLAGVLGVPAPDIRVRTTLVSRFLEEKPKAKATVTSSRRQA
jgi:hypothetical protein